MLYSVIMECEISADMLSDVLLGDYAWFPTSFNFLFYFLSAAPLSNSRIFLQRVNAKYFYSSSSFDVEQKVFTTNCWALFIFLILSSTVTPFLLLYNAQNTVRDPAVRRPPPTGEIFFHFSSAETKTKGCYCLE